jgi:hypothetical protein
MNLKIDDCTTAHLTESFEGIHIELETIDPETNEFENGDYCTISNATIEEIDTDKLAKWIEETYYTFDFLCDAHIPSSLHPDEFCL